MKLPEGIYYTVKEMAAQTGESSKTIYQRIFRANIKPVAPDALYDQAAFDFIKNSRPKGRPSKPHDPAREYVDFILESILKAVKTDEWELIEKPKPHNEAFNKAIANIKNAPNRRSRLKQFDRLFDELVKMSMESWYREQQTVPGIPTVITPKSEPESKPKPSKKAK
jgi:hypothetical protein